MLATSWWICWRRLIGMRSNGLKIKQLGTGDWERSRQAGVTELSYLSFICNDWHSLGVNHQDLLALNGWPSRKTIQCAQGPSNIARSIWKELTVEASKIYCNSCHLGTPGGATYGRGRSQFAALGILVFFSKGTICYLETWENDFGRRRWTWRSLRSCKFRAPTWWKMCDNPWGTSGL